MDDLREKVIKGLECCMSEKICNSPCPYKGQCDDGGYYFSKAIDDAIDLLKAQEPARVKKREFARMWLWCCGSCGVAITEGDKFCRMCGKAVKWE